MESQREILIKITKILGFKPAIDGLMSAVGNKLVIDIIQFDKQLEGRFREYDSRECTYQETADGISMSDFIKGKFGEEAVRLISLML